MKILDYFKRLFKRKQPKEPVKVITITRIKTRTTMIPVHNIPVTKSFKPRSAYEKRLWKNNKKLPRNFKDDEDEEDEKN